MISACRGLIVQTEKVNACLNTQHRAATGLLADVKDTELAIVTLDPDTSETPQQPCHQQKIPALQISLAVCMFCCCAGVLLCGNV